MNQRPHKPPTKRPRKAKLTDSICIQITTNLALCGIIDRIVKTGFFGNSRAAASERLLSERVREVVREGVIQRFKKLTDE